MKINSRALPLAIAAILTHTSAGFAQTGQAIAKAGTICVGPLSITESAYITIPQDNGSGFKFKGAGSTPGTPRTLPFAANINARSVYDTLELTKATAVVSGGRGCKLDVVNPVHLTFTVLPNESGVFQATGQLEVVVGSDTLADTNRGVSYTCALTVDFGSATTITDIQPGCSTITQTLTGIPLSFEWYRQ